MNKTITWAIRIPIIILFIILAMFMFKLCPPRGPWTMPPWCVAVESFEYSELDYISSNYRATNKELDFGIGTFDIWGNPHLFADLGDDTRNHYKETINRLGNINTELYLITDVVTFSHNGTMIYSDDTAESGGGTIGKKYMDEIGQLVKTNKIKKFMHLTNLADFSDDIDDYLSRDLSTAEKLVGEQFKKELEDSDSYVSSTNLNDYSKEQWDDLFDTWTNIMVKMAKKNQEAGVTHMVINPGDTGFNWRIDYDYQKEKYAEVAKEIKNHFSGKLGVYGRVDELSNMNWDFIDFHMPTFNADFDWMMDEDLKDVKDNVKDIKASITKYFAREYWSQIKDESYLSVTIPSITNGVRVGWMPQSESNKHSPDQKAQAIAYEALFQTLYDIDTNIDGVIAYGYWWNDRLYPETKVLRNDNDYTIRNKDAEKVFYKWNEIFR